MDMLCTYLCSESDEMEELLQKEIDNQKGGTQNSLISYLYPDAFLSFRSGSGDADTDREKKISFVLKSSLKVPCISFI